jgi:hypothetical protein
MERSFRSALIGLTGCALVIGGLVPQAHATLLAYYQAEGNANDSAGTHNGTLINGASFGAGQFGQAFQLNGTNQYVSVPDDPAWAFGANAFTISLWANFSSIRQGSVGSLPNVFVAQDNGGGGTNKWVFFYDGLGDLAFHINGPGSAFLTAPTTFTPAVGAWHMFSITRSASTYTFYGDGVSLGTASSSLSIPDATVPMTIGESEGIGFLAGRIDDVRIYNQALSATEIAALVPEPATIAVLGLGIAAMLRRRKRAGR